MKTLLKMSKFSLLLLITAITFESCNIFGVSGSGNLVTNEITLSEFNKIDLTIDADIEFIKSDIQKVEIVAQQNIFDLIKTNVRSEKWTIDFDKNVTDYETITIYIYVSEIISIVLSGTGYIYTNNTFSADEVEFSIPGSGDIDFLFDAEDTKISISGSGNIYLEGGTINQDITFSGSGKYSGFRFFSSESEISIPGSGDCEVYVHDKLFVDIGGSGNVYYIGDPTINSIITGSGDVIDAN